MPSLLTPRQAEELNKSIIGYLSGNGHSETALCFRKALNFTDDIFDATSTKQYETLLEKKWTSNSRLQKRIMELDSRNAALQCEVDNLKPTSLLKRNGDTENWLPQQPRYSLHSHRDSINCIAFHPRFSSIASGSDDFTIKIWDWEYGELEATLKGHTRTVRDVDYGDTSSGVLLASCSSDLTIKLWNPTDGYKNIRTLQGHEHIISAVRFLPSRDMLASASKDENVKLWNVTNGYCVITIQGHTGWVRDISPSFDGQFLLSTGDDMTVRLWDISSNQPECKFTAVGHENSSTCCAVAPVASFRYLASSLGLKQSTTAVEIMATGSRDRTIKIWDARGVCILTLIGHDSWVRGIAFHPGGKYLLSVSDDKTLRCWDLSQHGKCVKIIRDIHNGFITCLRWAPGVVKNLENSCVSHQWSDSPERHKSEALERDNPEVQPRCVLATGGADHKIQVFAG
ncbi:WD domain-containing protein [Penicillium angulare]|uniref:Nuclear distribution protein nudF n=1 Tax=Penicillium angulare TaxID=116970 RepID=A0A9W9K059_9EURO|nr:WD domain-containing protein [Penicillium angulare]